jgi:antitoxin component YwqK of YwqJK toxin-antitoxin module
LFTGTCVSYHENGKISFRGTYKDGETDGKCEWWYDSGQKMKEITYVSINGESLANGDYFVWFRNGQLMKKESFKMGTRDGDWIQYDINGKIIKKGTYKDGMHISGDKIVEVYQ